jgi:hypothetical protein
VKVRVHTTFCLPKKADVKQKFIFCPEAGFCITQSAGKYSPFSYPWLTLFYKMIAGKTYNLFRFI